jgi:hypothetical protein
LWLRYAKEKWLQSTLFFIYFIVKSILSLIFSY